MNVAKTLLAVALGALLLASCKKNEPDAAAPVAEAASRADAPAAPPAATRFDLSSVPVSTVPLGDFPYFGLPQGYTPLNEPERREVDRFPFWVGDRFEWVEGRTWSTFLGSEPGKEFSQLEIARNIEQMVKDAGGAKVFEGRVPEAAVKTLGDDIMVDRSTGIGGIANEPSTVYVVRRPDRTIWVYLNTYGAGGSLVVAETAPFVATAKLLPASELKQQIDTAGKVALQVNFATDRTDVLPESRPQLEQVVQLLQQDPSLKLSVEGHTDNSGDAAHNRQLSEGRAKAVVGALVAEGIDASRLSAQGFGDTQPVADNGTGEGRAKNRRVELVKR